MIHHHIHVLIIPPHVVDVVVVLLVVVIKGILAMNVKIVVNMNQIDLLGGLLLLVVLQLVLLVHVNHVILHSLLEKNVLLGQMPQLL
jgi:hypothetical protein